MKLTEFSLAPRPVNFIGGPMDGVNYISPAANCVLPIYIRGTKAGKYIFDGQAYQWISDTNKTEG
jgi:hypothetical protein